MNRLEQKRKRRARRRMHIRKTIHGTPQRPRMTVYKSSRYLYVQVIDDTQGHTLAAVSNLEKDLRAVKSNAAGAEQLGQTLGARLKEKKIARVVFDRNGYPYHGLVKSIAEGARKAGVQF
jgi:large subunit ribosomal protein L18